MRTTKQTIDTVIALKSLGFTYNEIQEELHISSKTISKILKQYKIDCLEDEDMEGEGYALIEDDFDLDAPLIIEEIDPSILEGQKRYYESLLKDTKQKNIIHIEWLVSGLLIILFIVTYIFN